MHCWIELSAQNLRHNFRILTTQVKPATAIPVIKSNAYGHGLKEVYQILATEAPPILAVNYIGEGEQLRSFGYQGRVLCVGPSLSDDFAYAYRQGVELLVGNHILLERWISLAEKPLIHLKFDTGMSRQGFLPEEATQVMNTTQQHLVHIRGICSHFANVEDVLEQEFAQNQLHLFQQVIATFKQHGINLPCHIASSASGLILPESMFDYVRDGIALYGLWPARATRLSFSKLFNHTLPLKPVLAFRTRVTSIKSIPKDQFIGYGCTYRANRDMTIAVLPVGYYEGFSRLAGDRGAYVLLHGTRCPVVGRICMNMLMIDITHLPQVRCEDVATLIGVDKKEEIDAETFSAWANTIHYEALARLNSLIPRQIIE